MKKFIYLFLLLLFNIYLFSITSNANQNISQNDDIYRFIKSIGIKTYQEDKDIRDKNKIACIAREFANINTSRLEITNEESEHIYKLGPVIQKPSNAIEGANFNIKCQMGYYVKNGVVIKVFEITTGLNNSTPRGIYKAERKTNGWRKSTLYDVNLYKPININGPIAIHGVPSPSMITYKPASHGCIRVPNKIMDFLFKNISIGDKTRIYQSW
jgi:hypothetical protein